MKNLCAAEIRERRNRKTKSKKIYLCVLTPYGILKTQNLDDTTETRQWFVNTAFELGLKLEKI